jgi:hypothetical protein
LAVALSALLPACRDDAWPDCARFEEYYQKLSRNGQPPVQELLRCVDEEFADMAPILKIASPKKPLVACFDEARCVLA